MLAQICSKKYILDLYTIGCLEIKYNQRPKSLFSHPLERASSFGDQKFNIIFTKNHCFCLHCEERTCTVSPQNDDNC